ncbi:type I restriction-modification system endonuclease [Deinococcus radiotolerans]|uniref:Type I restriction-modification system deoxyribonuclease n=1 Tax=Deinococcus radiotolerans TaxID=1309407 RepID=A0ABQ2FIW5_9DEIO|nr:type I restriction-modification system endonuclease [Deinococcus radiotolerans]GGK95648.1 type I restriction-modification system deoxyribonuclease [Deinococcus radiotolerans]
MPSSPPSNFEDLSRVEPLLAQLGTLAERYAVQDPNTALLKLRQYGELLARVIAARSGHLLDEDETQVARLARLQREGVLPREVWQLLTELRRAGNEANHAFTGEKQQALSHLKFGWIVGVWLIRTFHDATYTCGDFIDPPQREDAERLRTLLAEAEQARADAERRLKDAQSQAPKDTSGIATAANQAAARIHLSEEETRELIDAQLRAAGWETDSVQLRYAKGTRPTKGRNLAIAEWPVGDKERADYALFAGLTLVAVVEAKHKKKSVMSSLEQAARYSRHFNLASVPDLDYPHGPWGEYRVPFLFATNGRPYLAQLRTESGIWFRDARRPVNPSHPLPGWHTPQDLLALLHQDTAAADERLKSEPMEYELSLRLYQKTAIQAVEAGIAAGQRELLLAMATGTGKTKTAIALIYRLLKAGRFRRVLFLVDRETLGEQASNDFKTTRLEGTRTFAETFGLTAMGDGDIDTDTNVHVTTVQGLVRRVTGDAPPAVGTYDLIVVDEAHRGYTLDRELADAELGWRNENEYVSKYRQVIEYFDAVKVALTATPALHTTEIFGKPVYAYTYRQAVLDGVLIDHEPPTLIETELSMTGIRFKQGEQIPTYTPGADEVVLFEAPDDVGLEIEDFNRRVIAKGFNQAVCAFLAEHLNPFGPDKTLVFCVNDRHADEVVDLLREALRAKYGELDDGAVMKITGASDQPLQLTRRFRNESSPAIAVTVDLLTTGVDVPAISTLVFLRRVSSRILFEQMLGRATRRCDEIDKTVFRIYDAVRAYEAIQDFITMPAVVQQPKRSFVSLGEDLQAAPTTEARALLRDELVAKLQRVKGRLTDAARDTFEGETGHKPEAFIQVLRQATPDEAADLITQHAPMLTLLDTGRTSGGQPIYISEHADQVMYVQSEFPGGRRAEDYLSAFEQLVQKNQDLLPALSTVLTRPADLTRTDLLDLKRQLDAQGFSEVNLQRAYANVKNVDAAASIIGFIRAAALNESPQPFDARVDAALARLLGTKTWTPPQQKWLQRLAAQLKANGYLDRDLLDQPTNPVRKELGGFDRLSTAVFGGQLPDLLTEFQQDVWTASA